MEEDEVMERAPEWVLLNVHKRKFPLLRMTDTPECIHEQNSASLDWVDPLIALDVSSDESDEREWEGVLEEEEEEEEEDRKKINQMLNRILDRRR